jgi:flavodoxin I
MERIGIFFGTDTGRTRLIAKQIARKLQALASTPVNVGRTSVEEFLAYDAFILGTPTLAEGQLPGRSTGLSADSWEEFLPKLESANMSGKVVALYGLGEQEKYPANFCDGMGILYDFLQARNADMVGAWPDDGYCFTESQAVKGDHFVGLALDQVSQPSLTEARIEGWLSIVLPVLKMAIRA